VPDHHDLSRRLQRLHTYIAAAKPQPDDATATSSADRANWHMSNVRLDQIADLTIELQRRGDEAIDEVDAVEMRLLLNEYTASTTHLRAVTRIAKAGIATAAAHVRGVRTIIERELQRQKDDRFSSGDS